MPSLERGSTRRDDQAIEPLQVPAVVHQVVGEPVEQFEFRRRRAAEAEVGHRLDQRPVHVPHPDVIDGHPRGERVFPITTSGPVPCGGPCSCGGRESGGPLQARPALRVPGSRRERRRQRRPCRAPSPSLRATWRRPAALSGEKSAFREAAASSTWAASASACEIASVRANSAAAAASRFLRSRKFLSAARGRDRTRPAPSSDAPWPLGATFPHSSRGCGPGGASLCPPAAFHGDRRSP